jgi:hypothetical protein
MAAPSVGYYQDKVNERRVYEASDEYAVVKALRKLEMEFPKQPESTPIPGVEGGIGIGLRQVEMHQLHVRPGRPRVEGAQERAGQERGCLRGDFSRPTPLRWGATRLA